MGLFSKYITPKELEKKSIKYINFVDDIVTKKSNKKMRLWGGDKQYADKWRISDLFSRFFTQRAYIELNIGQFILLCEKPVLKTTVEKFLIELADDLWEKTYKYTMDEKFFHDVKLTKKEKEKFIKFNGFENYFPTPNVKQEEITETQDIDCEIIE